MKLIRIRNVIINLDQVTNVVRDDQGNVTLWLTSTTFQPDPWDEGGVPSSEEVKVEGEAASLLWSFLEQQSFDIMTVDI